MARNDEFFLNKWIEYYGSQLGEENLYVYLDGEDQPLPAKAGRANVEKLARKQTSAVAAGDKSRIKIISAKAGELLDRYDLVIGCDCDEFLAVDPALGMSLAEYLSSIEIKSSVSGLGLDVGQKLGEEGPLREDVKLLDQRSYAYVCSRYTKAVVIAVKGSRWGSGFHRFKGHNFHIDPNLYLFHFGCCNEEWLKQKLADPEKKDSGWSRHLRKRFRTIRYVTRKKPRGEEYLRIARITQTILRPIYALNKPSMCCWRLVVRIPERFRGMI